MSCNKKNFLIVLVAITCLLSVIVPEEHAVPFGEIGRISFSDSMQLRLEMKNDSYSMLSETDWDDLRTFGIYYGFSANKWAFEVITDSLTNRSTSTETNGRIDQLSFAITRQLMKRTIEPFSFDLAAGVGALSLGNIGSAWIQQTVHNVYGCSYHTPQNYDTSEQKIIILADAIVKASVETPLTDIYFYSTLEAGHTGFLRSGNYIQSGYSNGFLSSQFSLGFLQVKNYDNYTHTFTPTIDSENGFYAGGVFTAGFLSTGFSYNVTTTRQAGYIALSFPGNQKSAVAKIDNQTIEAIEYGILPLQASVRMRRALYLSPLTLSAIVGAESGPVVNIHHMIPYGIHYRYEQFYAGFDASIQVVSWIELYFMEAFGYRKDIITTRTIISSEIIEESQGVVHFGEAGFRLFLPSKKQRKSEWGLSIGTRIQALDSGLFPYTSIYLIGTTGRNSKSQ